MVNALVSNLVRFHRLPKQSVHDLDCLQANKVFTRVRSKGSSFPSHTE